MAVFAAAPRVALRAAFADPLLWAGTAAYAAIYFILGTVRYNAHRNFVDLGIFAQTAASGFGCFCNTVEGSHWAYHFSPLLYAAAALMRVWPSALSLIALSAIAGALTIPPVYALVFRYTDRRAARLAALVVFLYPPLAGAIFNDFHENSLAPAAVSWLLWAFDAGYVWPTLLFAALTLSVKEDQAVFLAVAGAIGFARYRGAPPRSYLCALIASAAVVILCAFFFIIQPAAAQHAHWAPSRFYAWRREDVAALLPWGILQRLGFLLLAFAPLLFLPFRSVAGVLLAAPLAEVLFSRDSTTFTIGSHYAGAWSGYAFYAFALAIGQVFGGDRKRAYALLSWCAVLCVLEFATANPLHPGYFLHVRGARDLRLDRFLNTLPRDASVSTQEEAYTHLAAANPRAGVLPESAQGPLDSCFILIDGDFPESPRYVESEPLVNALVSTDVYRERQRAGAIILYKRSAPCR